MTIKVCHAALDEAPNGDIILRGVLDPTHLHLLKVDDYQREVLPISSLSDLVEAFFRDEPVPDIELGMRGQRVNEQGDCYALFDDVYIVDGLQRREAALLAMQRGTTPRLGAAIHFGTTPVWERTRFEILNAQRTKLSSNVLLRNLRHELQAVQMLVRLSESPSFVLKGRVSWTQRQTRTELLSAMTFAKVSGRLHSHLGPTRGTNYAELAKGLEKTMKEIGRDTMRDNIHLFFDVVDNCWGIKRITYKEGAVYMRQSFLLALAEVLSGHLDFWRDNRLFVDAGLVRKIAQFPVSDPQVQNLASSSGKARQMLVLLMIDHINSGKRTRRLKPRKHFAIDETEEGEES
jgi:hypothetical protein